MAAAEDVSNNLGIRVDHVAKLIVPSPQQLESYFSASFLEAISAAKLAGIFKTFHDQLGSCRKINFVRSSGQYAGLFELECEKGYVLPVEIAVNPQGKHLIDSLRFRQVTRKVLPEQGSTSHSFEDLIVDLKKLPGTVSFLVAKIENDGAQYITQLNADKPLAIASASKLYILSTLIQAIQKKSARWDQVIALTERARSFPSGELHKWILGAPITVHTLATLMISESDNTAADELALFLGRQNIEETLTLSGHADPGLNAPFLMTSEFFKLKYDPSGNLTKQFLLKTQDDRREMLDKEIVKIDRRSIQIQTKAKYIDSIEWFASASDLVRLLSWIVRNAYSGDSKEAIKILAINPGSMKAEPWNFVGFKGGSEPGVLNMTYLLCSSNGDWYGVTLGWNSSESDLDPTKALILVQRAIGLIKPDS